MPPSYQSLIIPLRLFALLGCTADPSGADPSLLPPLAHVPYPTHGLLRPLAILLIREHPRHLNYAFLLFTFCGTPPIPRETGVGWGQHDVCRERTRLVH